MKTTKNLLTLAFAMFATYAFAQISSTKHNMANAAWNTGTDEICITCHTPHNALSVVGAPLWNHSETQVTGYTLYNTTTFDGSGTITDPAGTSKLCLGCHDGTVDLVAYGGTVDTGAGTRLTGDALLGTNLSTHHPVSFDYNATLFAADPGLHDPVNTQAVADLLFSEKVECASCHDAHDNTNGMFLRISNSGSALCLTCHNK